MKYSKKELDEVAEWYYITMIAQYGLSNALCIVKEINGRLKLEKKRRKNET